MKRLIAAVSAVVVAGALAACSPAVGLSSAPPGPDNPSTPNIVFVLTDDLSMNLVSHMPHVLGLEKAGTTMTHEYVADSLCCPSRSAIFTGQFPHDDGVFTNTGSDGGYTAFNHNGDEKKSFALALQKHGYRTAMMGKYLNGYQVTDPVPPGWSEWDVAGGGGYREFDYKLNEDGHVRSYGTGEQNYLTNVLSAKAGRFITSSNKPFMLEVATFAPHAPYTPSPKYAGTSTATYPRTPAYDTLPTDPPSWLKGDKPLTSKANASITSIYRKRVEAVRSVDDMIGHLEDTLKAKGVAKNTYVVFSSDNGYHMGEYRLLPGKQTAFDTDIHVPLVVSGPHVPAGHRVSRLTSEVDLAPTFERLTGSAVGGSVDGTSLASTLHGSPPDRWQDAVLVEHHHDAPNNPGDPDAQTTAHADPPTYEAVRTESRLYVRYAGGQQEYYDTARDPDELHNLGGAAAPQWLKTTLQRLTQCHGTAACQRAAGAR